MSSDQDQEHRRLLALIATSRDRAAFEALFVHFGPRLKAMFVKSGAGVAAAEDWAQDTMVAVWQKAGMYSPERGTATGWIYAIARNIRIDRLRRRAAAPYEDITALEIAAEAPEPEAVLDASDMADRVGAALRELPEDQRAVIEQSFLHDVPHAGIAKRLAIPVGTVKSRLRLAYAKLRAALEVRP